MRSPGTSSQQPRHRATVANGRNGSRAAIRIWPVKATRWTFPRHRSHSPEVADIYRAVDSLSERYPGRPFTPDGHLIGSIGEVVAAEAFGLQLYEPSKPIHDGYDSGGDVQIKITSGRHVSMLMLRQTSGSSCRKPARGRSSLRRLRRACLGGGGTTPKEWPTADKHQEAQGNCRCSAARLSPSSKIRSI
jgi:hypothetical protein